MLLNNHCDQALVHLIQNRATLPDTLEPSVNMFNEEYRRLKIMIDNNSYRCLSIALVQIPFGRERECESQFV